MRINLTADPLLQKLDSVLRSSTAATVSRYDNLSPQERQRAKWRERQRRHRERVRIAIKIPLRKRMCRLMQAGDREAAFWWHQYESGCRRNRIHRELGYGNLRKACAAAAEWRERRKREKEAAKWANSL